MREDESIQGQRALCRITFLPGIHFFAHIDVNS